MIRSGGSLALCLSVSQKCSYIDGRESSNLFVDPERSIDTHLYTHLAKAGFRRSGTLFYRPHCNGCTSCVPARIPVETFRMNRSQQRTWNRNRDLSLTRQQQCFREEHYDLYLRYQAAVHPDSQMKDMDRFRYQSFLCNAAMGEDVWFVEFRTGPRLLGVAVIDRLEDSLSAVYTFYEPEEKKRSLGTHAILWQVEEARKLGLSWVYLGYWIRECPKMAYKEGFKPLELLTPTGWTRLEQRGHVVES